MPGVAVNGSEINESIKSGHVTYEIWNYQWVRDRCISRDEDGFCTDWEPVYDWVHTSNGSTGARITGTVSVSSSKMKVEGVSVATVGDKTNERWEAYPPVPSGGGTTQIRNISPGTSGTGQGEIKTGSNKGKLQGKQIALIGSTVTTCLGTTTTIKTGNEKLKFGS